jgi:hypothetical protein
MIIGFIAAAMLIDGKAKKPSNGFNLAVVQVQPKGPGNGARQWSEIHSTKSPTAGAYHIRESGKCRGEGRDPVRDGRDV